MDCAVLEGQRGFSRERESRLDLPLITTQPFGSPALSPNVVYEGRVYDNFDCNMYVALHMIWSQMDHFKGFTFFCSSKCIQWQK